MFSLILHFPRFYSFSVRFTWWCKIGGFTVRVRARVCVFSAEYAYMYFMQPYAETNS